MFLSFTSLFLASLCAGSPAKVEKRIDVPPSSSGGSSGPTATSILVVTGSPNAAELVTFYPSRVSDTQLWTITTTTVLSLTETVYPSGYEWIASPAPRGPTPAVPSDALFPIPGAISISFPQRSSIVSSTGASSSTLGGSISVSSTSGSASAGASASQSSLSGSPSLSSSITSGSAASSSAVSGSSTSGSSSSVSSISDSASSSLASGSSSAQSSDISGSPSSASSATANLPSSQSSAGGPSSTGGAGAAGSSSTSGLSSRQSGQIAPSSSASSKSGGSVSSSSSSVVANSVVAQNSSLSSTSQSSSGSISVTTSLSSSGSSSGSILARSSSRAQSASTSNNAGPSKGQSASITSNPGASKSDEPTTSFVYPILPSTTVSGAAATSHAAAVGVLFFALHANLPWLKDPTLKSQYIDNVNKIKDQTDSLFNKLDTKPPIPAPCQNPKRKRDVSRPQQHHRRRRAGRTVARRKSLAERDGSSLEKGSFLSGITDLVGDVGKLLGCATGVLDKLSQDVKLPDPPTAEIEDLTGALEELGEDLKDEDENDDPSHSASKSDPSSTKNEDSASSSATSSPSSASSASSTVSSSASSTLGGSYCAPTCQPCLNGLPNRKAKRSEELDRRTLEDPGNYDVLAEYIVDEKLMKGGIELEHRMSGTYSSAVVSNWETEPKYLWVAGLYGCTSVVIISEAGVWFSHLFESPSFLFADTNNNFQLQVLDTIRNGDTSKMPAAFGLQQPGNILAPDTNAQIFISTPNGANGGLMYQTQVDQIVDALTGNGAPYHGVQVTTQGYVKATGDISKAIRQSVRGKVLIEYDNNQIDDPDNPPPQQTAIWRIFLEDKTWKHEWVARDNQKGACALPSALGVQKRDQPAGCSRPSGSSGSISTSLASFVSGNSAQSSGSSSTSAGSSKDTTGPTTLTSAPSSKTDFAKSSGTGPITSAPSSSPSSSAKSFTYSCYPFADPDAGITQPLCQCDGLTGKFPALPSPMQSTSDFDPCAYTSSPTIGSTSIPPFTTTESDGEVLVCQTSTYYNYAVETDATCAGSSTAISTVASIASAFSSSVSASAASVSSASAEASWTSAAAVPSAACWILDDDGFGDSAFAVYGINGWAGHDGGKLFDQEDGCGLLSGFEFHSGETQMFEGKERDTESAAFGLSFFKGGCVERAVHSAGGPEPGNGPGQLACKHGNGPVSDSTVKNIKNAQLKAVSKVATANAPKPRGLLQRLGVTKSEKRTDETQYDPEVIASAKAALPHLQAAVSQLGGPQPTPKA